MPTTCDATVATRNPCIAQDTMARRGNSQTTCHGTGLNTQQARTCPRAHPGPSAGTDRPGWLKTGHPRRGFAAQRGIVCFQYSSTVCYWQVSVETCVCSYDGGATDTYLYKLQRPNGCNSAYCGSDDPIELSRPMPPAPPPPPPSSPPSPLPATPAAVAPTSISTRSTPTVHYLPLELPTQCNGLSAHGCMALYRLCLQHTLHFIPMRPVSPAADAFKLRPRPRPAGTSFRVRPARMPQSPVFISAMWHP